MADSLGIDTTEWDNLKDLPEPAVEETADNKKDEL